LRSTRSSSRPGVATTRSAPPRKLSSCGLIDTPPMATNVRGGPSRCRPKLRAASAICVASSCVGTSTSARTGLGDPGGLAASNSSSGRMNAAVFPEPVCADAHTSPPRKIAGIAALCTGVGAANSCSATARASGEDRPRAVKGM
jgi:hypothetical protein